jgi:hypothetical protein
MASASSPVAATDETDLILFVAGEPDPRAGRTREAEVSAVRRLAGAVVGVRWISPMGCPAGSTSDQAPTCDDRSWRIPPQQVMCVNLVAEIAQSLGKRVALVDVNRPVGRQNLVDYWVGSNAVLPLLVRPDGTRLEGIEEFVPGKLRQFIRQPSRASSRSDLPLTGA